MSDPTIENQSLSESQKLRKRLPEIPAEELAKHGDVKISHELPLEVQAQLKRRQFRNNPHKRSRSLSGIEALYEQPGSQEPEKGSDDTRKENLMPDTVNNNAVSLPSTPVIKRRSSDGGKSTDSQDQEIIKELRWHYKQYLKVSKRKKEKGVEVGVPGSETDRVLSAVQVVLNNEAPQETSTQINTNRCNICSQHVEILERVAVENHVFHKTCFVCAICGSWLNHFNYCFVPDHDKFYCIQHYQDIESASVGIDEQIRHALGIGPGVQQQFHYVPESVDSKPKDSENKAVSKVQNNLNVMKEKISLLSKRGKKLEKKCKKLRKQIDNFKGNELEKGQLWEDLFESEQDKNSTFRRESELTFKVRELELSEKYLELEKKLRALTEKTDKVKTEYDKSNEKELLQEMLVVVEKREHLIAEMDAAKLKYAEEDRVLEKQKEELGINQPDLVKQAAAADNEAKKVSQAVKQAPATIKKHSPFGCCILL